jgi:hypothetical protein
VANTRENPSLRELNANFDFRLVARAAGRAGMTKAP